jgi:integrase
MQTEKIENKSRYSPQDHTEPATSTGFRNSISYGDKMGTRKYIHYKPAQIYSKGTKWFVWYSFLDESTGKFKRFRLYEDLNRIKDLKERMYEAKKLKEAVDIWLARGHNPFIEPQTVFYKVWTLNQAINYFKQKIPDMGLRSKSEQNYTSMLSLLSPAFGRYLNVPIEEVNKKVCMAVMAELKKSREWGNTRYNNVLRFARSIFNYFIEHEICDHNPFKDIKPLKETITMHQPFTNTDWERIKQKADPDLLRFINFMYYTGTRPNEARQLKHEHILRDRKILLVPGEISKNKTDGYVPLSDKFLELFPKGSGFIFGTGKNHYGNKFRELRNKLRLPEGFTLYGVKHTRAVHLAEDGASPYAIMQLFRHSSIEVTMDYLRGLGINIGREAAEKAR